MEVEFDFKLTQKEMSTVLTGLGNLPYVQSTGVINKISKAFAEQQNAIDKKDQEGK